MQDCYDLSHTVLIFLSFSFMVSPSLSLALVLSPTVYPSLLVLLFLVVYGCIMINLSCLFLYGGHESSQMHSLSMCCYSWPIQSNYITFTGRISDSYSIQSTSVSFEALWSCVFFAPTVNMIKNQWRGKLLLVR